METRNEISLSSVPDLFLCPISLHFSNSTPSSINHLPVSHFIDYINGTEICTSLENGTFIMRVMKKDDTSLSRR